MSYEPEPYSADPGAAARRTQAPGIFLIVVGILNLLGALSDFGIAGVMGAMPPEQFQQIMAQQSPQNRKALEEQNIGPEQLRKIYVYGGAIAGAVALVFSLVILFGGIRMMALRSYGLAVFASILAMIPCISPCCIVGVIAGIWGLAVLMSQDVKSAFR